MFHKVLIANRGEIAVRIIRACRELGVATVAVFSEADRTALHAQLADEAICIGPANTADSYLNIKAILAACEVTGADALHPGFGFLSENAAFARMCEKCGVAFIGPPASSMEQMGDKSSLSDARRIAEEIGYPVMVKASAGGGGRGIRRVDAPSQLEAALTAAKEEALRFFGDDGVYIEKFIEDPRHVEIQILADSYGNVVSLGERDCSLQRRNQKLIEECPCPIMTPSLRKAMGQAAVKAAVACGYRSAGTVEFLLEGKEFYFMEMNTRIQVEHPITEMVTGIDLVKTQIRIAAGEPLPFRQEDVKLNGHAIECRINAENPAQNFRPCPGRISALHMPGGPGIRIDSAVYQGCEITPYYDSMIAKLITYAPTREEALMKMKWALAEFIVEGVDTNIDFQLNLIKDADVEAGRYDIGFLSRRKDLFPKA